MGSNKNKYTKNRLSHILSSIPYSILSLVSKRDEKLIVFCAMHCDTFVSNSKFLFLYFLQNKPEYNVQFVINDDDLRNKLINEYGPHFIDTRTNEGKKIAIKAKTWVVSWIDLPIGGLFLNFRRFVLHLGHGTPLKCIGITEKDGKFIKKLYYKLNTTNISMSLASSTFVSEIVSACMGLPLKRILIKGQPRNDSLFYTPQKLSCIDSKSFNIIYAPTWRQYAEVKLFPFDDFDYNDFDSFLKENNIKIFIRFHPAYEESIPTEYLKSTNIQLFSAKEYTEIMDYINIFDALITDYSSIYLDYMLLKRPIMFLPYDLDQYKNTVGLTMDYNDNTPGPKPINYIEFKNSLLEFKNNPENYIKLVSDLNEKLNNNTLSACKDIGDFLINEKI